MYAKAIASQPFRKKDGQKNKFGNEIYETI